jgi:hypothetical protein
MIRLIRKRLIIPRGDTGSFSIPTLGTVGEGDIAIFSLIDIITHEVKLTKMIYATTPTLIFSFITEDTINLEPKKYNWDITIYRSPYFDEDGELIGAAEVNSYYSAFKLPICEIKEVARNMNTERWKTRDLLENNPSNGIPFSNIKTIYPWENLQLNILSQQIYEIAKMNGYNDSEENFFKKFSQGSVIVDSINNFPLFGEKNTLYLDKDTNILYYFISTENIISQELANILNIRIIPPEELNLENTTNLYIPIKAMPIENLILGGDLI